MSQPIKITEAEQKSGIYSITNILNNKVYYGSSVNCVRRWSEHKTALIHDKHYNIHLQRAWNKYGKSNFRFDVVENVSADQLQIVEQQYLDFTNTFSMWTYNISKSVAHTNRGIKFSDESRRKMSIASKKRKPSDETKLKMSLSHKGKNTWTAGNPANNRDKTIYTFRNTLTNEVFCGIRVDFQKKYNLSQGTLGAVLCGKRLSHKNWELLIT